MKYRYLSILMTVFGFYFPLLAISSVDYNTWYSSDGILYDTTQTSQSAPVLITLPATDNTAAGMVITFESPIPCDKIPIMQPLKIDAEEVKYRYSCSYTGNSYYVSYATNDPDTINRVLTRLHAGFTVILMQNIRVWAGNINKPLYGKGNWTHD